MESFLSITAKIKDVFEERGTGTDIDWEQENQLLTLYAKLTVLVDTSEIPKKGKFARIHISVSELSEVLDRIPVPPIDSIPDYKEVKADKRTFWRIPDTKIALILVKEGNRKGDWIFSAETVRKTAAFYQSVEHLPYKKDAVVGLINNSTGILDRYIAYTGPIVPVNLTNAIPDWLRVKVLETPLWKYLATGLILLILLVLGVLLHKITRFIGDHRHSQNPIRLCIRRLILPTVFMILLPITINMITIDIRLRMLPLEIMDDLLWGIFYLISIWFTIDIANLISSIIVKSIGVQPESAHAGFVRLCSRVIAYSVSLWILFAGLKDLGLSLVPLLAGVSVGGLAFALAAKPSLANLLGSVLIFADKPFLVGERVIIGEHTGTVENIGLRSTRLRTRGGHHVSIPNDVVCKLDIENIARRPNIRRTLNLGLTYDTSPEKIIRAIEIVRQLLALEEDAGKKDEELGRPSNLHINNHAQYPPRVYFDKLNADSLNLQVNYWFSPASDYWLYLEHATWINIELIRRFGDEGIDFAFPTQTLDIKQPFSISMDGGTTTSEV